MPLRETRMTLSLTRPNREPALLLLASFAKLADPRSCHARRHSLTAILFQSTDGHSGDFVVMNPCGT